MSTRRVSTCLFLLVLCTSLVHAEELRLQPSDTGLSLDLIRPLVQQPEGDPPLEKEEAAATPKAGLAYATQGSVAWWFEVGGGSNFDRGWMALGGVGVEWYPVDGFALGLRADGIGIGLKDTPSTAGGGVSLLLRWHVLRREEWSLFIEGGCGVAYFSRAVPTGAAHLNFTPELGVGVSVAITEEMRLLAGVRWYHISNAQTASRNPGVDMLEIYVGAAFTF